LIGIIDIGVGNTASLKSSLLQIGVYPLSVRNRSDLFSCTHVIMPGVGHFDSVIKALHKVDLFDPLLEFIQTSGKKYLGICVGMQILFESSEEGSELGLGVFDGAVSRFKDSKMNSLPPNMRSMKLVGPNNNLSSDKFYFMHNYAIQNHENSIDERYFSNYCGLEFLSLIQHQGTWGAQFHPERSGIEGLSFFKAFLR